MSEMGELYRAWEHEKRDRRNRNLADAQERFDHGDWTHHTEYHWSRDLAGSRLDYWPSRKKFRWQNRNHVGSVDELMAFIRRHEVLVD